MPAYRTIIVDDNSKQQELLQSLLTRHQDLNICAICSTADEALVAIEKWEPHLLLLDVEMPGKTGFQLLEALPHIGFQVIFTTAYAKYAVDAFRAAALHFLLKPVDKAAMDEALDRFRQRQNQTDGVHVRHLLANLSATDALEKKIGLPAANGLLFVRMADILKLSVQGSYTIFHLADRQQHVVSRTLKECEALLPPAHFVRIHQSHLINLRYLKRYIKGDGGEVEMDDGSRLEVSRRMKDDLLEAMSRL